MFRQNNFPKHVELTGIINKPLLLHLVGCLYYLYPWCTVKQIPDNEIYLLIKYIKSVLWRVAKRLSCIQDARCLKLKDPFQYYSHSCSKLFQVPSRNRVVRPERCMLSCVPFMLHVAPVILHHFRDAFLLSPNTFKPPGLDNLPSLHYRRGGHLDLGVVFFVHQYVAGSLQPGAFRR